MFFYRTFKQRWYDIFNNENESIFLLKITIRKLIKYSQYCPISRGCGVCGPDDWAPPAEQPVALGSRVYGRDASVPHRPVSLLHHRVRWTVIARGVMYTSADARSPVQRWHVSRGFSKSPVIIWNHYCIIALIVRRHLNHCCPHIPTWDAWRAALHRGTHRISALNNSARFSNRRLPISPIPEPS